MIESRSRGRSQGRRRLPAGWLVVVAVIVCGAQPPSAYHLESGALSRDRVVVLGRDLIVEGEVLSHAVAIDGSARINGQVHGDVIVIGGDAVIGPKGECDGDVFVLGGIIRTEAGAEISGRSVVYPDSSAMWLALLEGPTLGLPASSPIVIGAKLALLSFWALLLVSIFAIARRSVLSTSESVRTEPFRNFIVGLTGVAAMTLTALFFAMFSGVVVGIPLLVVVAVVALVLRFWGMVAVFHAFGEWIGGFLPFRISTPVTSATCGLLALGVLKFIPWLGVWSWTVATLIGVGAALTTKLGKREPWFEAM